MPEKLQPGSHSVDRATPRKSPDGKAWVLNFRVCYRDGTLSHSLRAQAATAGEARRRARIKAESLLATDGTSTYTFGHRCGQFLDNEVKPTIETNPNLAPRTRDRYLLSLAQIRKYTASSPLNVFAIPRSIKKILEKIATDIGTESARQARNVLSAYIIAALRDHGLVRDNPIKGVRLAVTQPTPRTRQSISVAQWQAVLAWVCDDDPTAPMPGKTSGAAHKKDARARHDRVRLLTLLQATTGARMVEALALTWENVTREDGHVWVRLHGKTKKDRTVPILDERVAGIIWSLRRDHGLVIPAPADPDKPWDRNLASRAVREYYPAIAAATGVTALITERGHIWRSVLNTATAGVLAPHIRSAYFGHTEDVNASSYTSLVDVRPVLDAIDDVRSDVR